MEILIRDLKIASYLLTVLTMLRRIVQKAKSKQSSKPGDLDYSVEKSKSADHMVSVGYSEAQRDASSKRKEACERMAAAITANQLKMPGGAEELRAVLGGGANIPFGSSCDVFIGTPSHRAMMREVSAGISEKKEYVVRPIYHNTEDTMSESGGSDDYLPF
jgi:hypothetical protein